MKAIAIALYLMNYAGGAPVFVASFPTMAECVASVEAVRESGPGNAFGRYVCVPIMRASE
ncbi:MAG: hypothetical protein EOQ31_31510 [Mesorhizobium sp.]|uniref:hypothetical protein n=1 Tax=Mesorhizobium sp. TaxID=1871066 RepID=UPI000FE5B6D2|nr:hypothetical protein [Mesorhizobium sp.]RWA81474.1 MAG: hypothetical protein EOQ31_31510 [Mesorhizobium sp.]